MEGIHPVETRQVEMVDWDVAHILRAKTPAERLAMGLECNDAARALLACRLGSQFPDWTAAEIQKEVARRMLGDTVGAVAPGG